MTLYDNYRYRKPPCTGPTTLQVFDTNNGLYQVFNASFERVNQKMSSLAKSMTNRVGLWSGRELDRIDLIKDRVKTLSTANYER